MEKKAADQWKGFPGVKLAKTMTKMITAVVKIKGGKVKEFKHNVIIIEKYCFGHFTIFAYYIIHVFFHGFDVLSTNLVDNKTKKKH